MKTKNISEIKYLDIKKQKQKSVKIGCLSTVSGVKTFETNKVPKFSIKFKNGKKHKNWGGCETVMIGNDGKLYYSDRGCYTEVIDDEDFEITMSLESK